MNDIKLILSYDGTRFFGWQKTKTGPSIQEELERAVARILGIPVEPEAASRTDRGVHARGQVVHFRCPEDIDPLSLLRSLNAVLPFEISVRSIEKVDPSFHPTLQARSKEYHYWICNTPVQAPIHRLYSWHYHQPLNIDLMQQASLSLIGAHDFSALANIRTDDALRFIEHVAVVRTDDGRVRIEIRADRFLYKMARNIAGTLVYIGCGKLPPDRIPSLLASKDRKQGGITAPAHGLFLMEVFYPIY